MKEYILWIDGGCYEGWFPYYFDDLEELGKEINKCECIGEEFEVTVKLDWMLTHGLEVKEEC